MIDFILALGLACADHHGNGVWFQEGLPYRYDLCSASWELGVKKGPWSAGITRIVSTASNALALTNDLYYDVAAKKCRMRCDHTGYFRTSGSVHGIFLRREWTFPVTIQGTRTEVVFELGGTAFRPKHVVEISDFYGTEPDGKKSASPMYATYKNEFEIRFSPSIGIGYRSGNSTVKLQYHSSVKSCGDTKTDDGKSYKCLSSLYNGDVLQLMVSVAF